MRSRDANVIEKREGGGRRNDERSGEVRRHAESVLKDPLVQLPHGSWVFMMCEIVQVPSLVTQEDALTQTHVQEQVDPKRLIDNGADRCGSASCLSPPIRSESVKRKIRYFVRWPR